MFKFGFAGSPKNFISQNKKYKHFKTSPNPQNWQENLLFNTMEEDNTTHLNRWRKILYLMIFIITFALFFTRLFHLQIVEGEKNRELADTNRIKIQIIHAPRGVIYDRNGKILAQNEPAFRLIEQTDKTTKSTLISRDEALKTRVAESDKAESVEVDNIRFYPFGEKTSHVLGYIGEITDHELLDPKFNNYKIGDKIGRGGVEETYESFLKGVDGGEIVEIDAQGRKVRRLRLIPAIPGHNLNLTIDVDLQQIAYKLTMGTIEKYKVCCAAVVVQNPNNGQILSLVSVPSYNPQNIEQAINSSNSPLLNRVTSGIYPPGSIFKLVSSLAGLVSGKITASTTFEDTGVMKLGPFTFANWYFTEYGKTEGTIDIIKALKRSNDIYFYQLGYIVGEQIIADTARKLGLGKITGIDLPSEVAGLIPDNDWKVKKFNQSWYPGDTLHTAIGQGYVLTTPLQVNYLLSTIASGGSQYPPHLVMSIVSSKGEEIKKYDYGPLNSFQFDPSYISLIKSGLEEVPKVGGTAWPFFNFPIPTAGKTGTAEFGDPDNSTHAWYVSYAPADRPQISITVIIERGGEGSTVASPIAKELYRWYFSENKSSLINDINITTTENPKTLGE